MARASVGLIAAHPSDVCTENSAVDFKQQLMNQAFKLLQDPRISKALQNPRVMQGIMSAVQMSTKVQENLDASVKRVVHGLNLATSEEVHELRRTVERLENELEDQRRSDD